MENEQQRYFVRVSRVGPWIEVTKDKYIDLEQAAGFRSKVPGEVACGSFGSGCIDGTTSFPKVYVQGSYIEAEGPFSSKYEPAKNVIEIGSDWYIALGIGEKQ